MVDDEGKARNKNFTGHPGLANQISKNNVCKLYLTKGVLKVSMKDNSMK